MRYFKAIQRLNKRKLFQFKLKFGKYISCYKQCPITSVLVKHVFSKLKNILMIEDKFYRKKFRDVPTYMIINFNKNNNFVCSFNK